MRFSVFLLLLLAAAVGMASGKPVICIDPGHPSEVGRGTQGKKYTEIAVVWKVALLLKKKLEADGYRVVLTKKTEEEMVRNKRRAEIANASHAALLVRLHCDAEGGSGFRTYYPSRQGQVKGFRGPSAGVLRSSRVAASAFHRAAMASLGGMVANRGLKTDLATAIGAKQGALTGSIYSKVPVLLVEMLVLTNPSEEEFLSDHDGFEKLAEALRQGVHAAVRKR
jgi:N-acetylmuramoyl-L-alanine amidase